MCGRLEVIGRSDPTLPQLKAQQARLEPLAGVREDLPGSRCVRGAEYERGKVRSFCCSDLTPLGHVNAGQTATGRPAKAGGCLEGFYGRSEEIRCPKVPDDGIGELSDSRPKAVGKLSDGFLPVPLKVMARRPVD